MDANDNFRQIDPEDLMTMEDIKQPMTPAEHRIEEIRKRRMLHRAKQCFIRNNLSKNYFHRGNR